tara:strand:- start:3563 stop:4183 length:621 start_codon:yes stop_codon:yes gene_type:complete
MKTSVYPLFSKVIYLTKLNVDTKKIINLLDYNFSKAAIVNYKNVSQTSDCKTVLKDKKLKYLKNILMKEFYSYSKNILHYTNNFKITTSWFTKATKNQGCNYHNHSNSMISGVLYLNCGKESAISFENFRNDRMFNLTPKKYDVYNSDEYKFKTSDGMLIFFPSETYHRIVNNKSNKIRYSLAFNLIPVGPIGDKTNDGFVNIDTK